MRGGENNQLPARVVLPAVQATAMAVLSSSLVN